MSKKLVLTLDEATTEKYLALAQERTKAMVDEGCEPSDVLLKINIGANQIYGNTVFFQDTDIGHALVSWEDA